MNNKKTIKNIVIGLVIVVILAVVYSVVVGNPETGTSSAGSLSSLAGQSNMGQIKETDTTLANAEILRILGNIETINLDDDIFSNPVFRELEDSLFVIPNPVRIGRPNPFLPIGFDTFASTPATFESGTGLGTTGSSDFFGGGTESTDPLTETQSTETTEGDLSL